MSGGEVDLYDSDIERIGRVMEDLKVRSISRRDLDAFDREIKERFHQIGLIVRVNWYETNVGEVYIPEIVPTARVEGEKFVYDHNQQVHEVTNDLLGLGEGGVIKTTKDMLDGGDPHKH